MLLSVLLLSACSERPEEHLAPEPVIKAGFLAGAGSAQISPEPGAFIAGDARNRRFTGVHDPLYVKAVVLQNGPVAIAIVTVDNIGLTRPDIEVIRQRASTYAALPGLTPERIIVSSTHTHSGPDVVGLWGEHEGVSGRDPAYVDRLVTAVATQISAAAASLAPATMRGASGVRDINWVENTSEPKLLDRQMGVLQFAMPSA